MHLDPKSTIKQYGLRYVCDDEPGFSRRRCGKGFRYVTPEGKTLPDGSQKDRIKSLVIPPAWNQVWICKTEDGHLQASGIDTKQRKQYRYHDLWQEISNRLKFDTLKEFGEHLPAIRRSVAKDLDAKEITKTTLTALVIALLDYTSMRVGSKEYAKTNKTYGISTLQNKHLAKHGSRLDIDFVGKHNKKQHIEIRDSHLIELLQECQELPGQNLFSYTNIFGETSLIGSTEIYEYLQQVCNQEFTAKDFRTWNGCIYMFEFLENAVISNSKKTPATLIKDGIKHVAAELGNTPSVSKQYYIHPQLQAKNEFANIAKFIKTADYSSKPYFSKSEAGFLTTLHT